MFWPFTVSFNIRNKLYALPRENISLLAKPTLAK